MHGNYEEKRSVTSSHNSSGPEETTSGDHVAVSGRDVRQISVTSRSMLLSPSIVVMEAEDGTEMPVLCSPPLPPPPPPPPLPQLAAVCCPSQVASPHRRSGTTRRRLQWSKISTSRVCAAAADNVWTRITRMQQTLAQTNTVADDAASAGETVDLVSLEELFSRGSSTGGVMTVDEDDQQLSTEDSGHNTRRTTDQIQLIDSKRSMNVCIFLRQFSGQRGGTDSSRLVVKWLREGDSSVLGAEQLRALRRVCPEPHDVQLLTPYIDSDDISKLAAAERFYVHLIALPNYKLHIDALLVKEDFQTTIDTLKPAIDAIILSAREIKSSEVLREILSIVLVVGNFLNSGGYGGDAAGFRLSCLLKLRDIRANKSTVNLLQYVATESKKRNSHVLENLQQLSKYLPEASQYSVHSLTSDIKSLKHSVHSVTEQLDTVNSVIQQQFRRQMNTFIKSADRELNQLELDQLELEQLRRQLADYFCEDVATFQLDDCISTLHVFTHQLTSAIHENEKRREVDERMERRRRQQQQLANRRPSSAQVAADQFIPRSGSADQLQLPSSASSSSSSRQQWLLAEEGPGRRLSAPERQVSSGGSSRAQSPVSHHQTASARRPAFHTVAAAPRSMSVDVTRSLAPISVLGDDDLVQLLTSCDDQLRTSCCTPPRQRRRRPSPSNMSSDGSCSSLVGDAEWTRERTPSPALYERSVSPCLQPGSQSAGVSLLDRQRQARRRSGITRLAAATKNAAHRSADCSPTSSTSRLLTPPATAAVVDDDDVDWSVVRQQSESVRLQSDCSADDVVDLTTERHAGPQLSTTSAASNNSDSRAADSLDTAVTLNSDNAAHQSSSSHTSRNEPSRRCDVNVTGPQRRSTSTKDVDTSSCVQSLAMSAARHRSPVNTSSSLDNSPAVIATNSTCSSVDSDKLFNDDVEPTKTFKSYARLGR